MAVASVEMMPVEFPIVGVRGAFNLDDVVKLNGVKADLRGVVTESKTKDYGNPPVPGLAMKIAINRGDLTPFRNGGFAGYEILGNGGASGTVRTPCLVKYLARLMKTTELQRMLDVAEVLIARAATLKSDGNARKWFGTKATSKEELAKIHRRCAELQQRVAALSHVVFQCAAGEFLGAINNDDPLRSGGGKCRIQLGRGFMYDRYSWGERVCTIVHEMTHWFLGTVDEKLTDGSDAYGAACIRMAESDADCRKALNNADNWAFYICEYRTSSEAGDWSNFTEQEIVARGPFVSGAYNVVDSLVARYN